MDLFHLEYFCTVALTKNISEAARKHYISQPAMSKYMSHIEKELQMPLFVRNGNQIKLSVEGEKFYMHAKRIIGEYQDALISMEDGQKRLNINIQVNTTRHILLRFLKDFLKSHPRVDILIDFNTRQDLLESSDISNMYHFVIGASNMHLYQNKFHHLFSERLMLAVPKAHEFAARKSISVCELKDEFFVLQGKEKGYSKTLVKCCHENGFVPKIRMLCHETKYLCNMVAAGIGLSLFPEFSWSDMLDEDVVLVELEELREHTLNHAIYWNDNRSYPKEMIEFRDGLVDYYRNATRQL